MLTPEHYATIKQYVTQLAWRRSIQFIEDITQDVCVELLRWPPAELTGALLYTVCKRMIDRALRAIYTSVEDVRKDYVKACDTLVDLARGVEARYYEMELRRMLVKAKDSFYDLAHKASIDYFFNDLSNLELEQKYGGRSAMQMVYQAKSKLKKILFSN